MTACSLFPLFPTSSPNGIPLTDRLGKLAPSPAHFASQNSQCPYVPLPFSSSQCPTLCHRSTPAPCAAAIALSDTFRMKAEVVALVAGIVGGIGVLCFFVAFATDYWLLASDDCGGYGQLQSTVSPTVEELSHSTPSSTMQSNTTPSNTIQSNATQSNSTQSNSTESSSPELSSPESSSTVVSLACVLSCRK